MRISRAWFDGQFRSMQLFMEYSKGDDSRAALSAFAIERGQAGSMHGRLHLGCDRGYATGIPDVPATPGRRIDRHKSSRFVYSRDVCPRLSDIGGWHRGLLPDERVSCPEFGGRAPL